MEEKAITVLFDLDGVIIDTEPQYDIFWKKLGEDYQLGIENFEQKVKGTTLPNIISAFFSHFSKEEIQKILDANHQCDLTMDMPLIPGVWAFLTGLKKRGIKMGLVTSSDEEKLEIVYKHWDLKPFFDTVVSADRITRGKPDPMAYLLAANDLGADPSQCVVFEDSFHGIQSGTSAGMKVVGLSTTNSAESLKNKVIRVMPDFLSFGINDLVNLF